MDQANERSYRVCDIGKDQTCRRASRGRIGHAGASILALALALGASAPPARAIKIPLNLDNDELQLNISIFVQPHLRLTSQVVPDPNPDHLGPINTDFYLRHMRLFFFGQVMKGLTFFVDTDAANWGQGGKFDQPFFEQDVMIMGEYVPNHFVDAGFILVPFSHFSLQGAAGLQGLDYPVTLVRPPNGVGKAWRDVGVQLRGYFWDKRIMYRVGAFQGTSRDTIMAGATPAMGMAPSIHLNTDAIPRAAGVVRFSILGRETDFFLKGIYFSDKPILSIGVGADYQHNAVPGKTTAQDYLAASFDIFAELPFNADMELILQATGYRHSQGDLLVANDGWGGVFEAGFRYKVFEVYTLDEYFKADDQGDGKKYDTLIAHGGVIWWIKRHNANFKADFAFRRNGDLSVGKNDAFTGILQGQVFF